MFKLFKRDKEVELAMKVIENQCEEIDEFCKSVYVVFDKARFLQEMMLLKVSPNKIYQEFLSCIAQRTKEQKKRIHK
jgi:hypothetical protein